MTNVCMAARRSLMLLAGAPVTAQQQNISTSICNSGPANPPARNALRGAPADGWMAQGRCTLRPRAVQQPALHGHAACGCDGPKVEAMGHKVMPVNGSIVGGAQTILFTPDVTEAPPDMARTSRRPINGTYRPGSDRRKDGQAGAW